MLGHLKMLFFNTKTQITYLWEGDQVGGSYLAPRLRKFIQSFLSGLVTFSDADLGMPNNG